ncbi:MAG TPA: DUF695 domain-containing protein [Dermatophilaceae bacterium]|nr:DUF695 domain-containing protein [Dermatophilaceae bacterium]
MGLFRRRRDSSGDGRGRAIEAFWSWWSAGGADLVALGAAPQASPSARGDAVTQLTTRVKALDPNLAWEVAGGTTSDHLLVLSARGNADLRPLARRWWLAAPAPDGRWAFADTRPPVPDPQTWRVQLGAWTIDLARAMADARVDGAALHVSVFHPDFHHLDEGSRSVAAAILLEALLGEADLEVWVEGIRGSDVEPLDPVPLLGLRAVVRDLKAAHTDPYGRAGWAELRGSSPDGRPLQAAVQVPLRPGTAPHLDSYVAVVVPFAEVTEEGFAGPGSSGRLRQLQQQLADQLGAGGAVVGHQTHGGTRVLHVYLDSTAGALGKVRDAVSGWPEGQVHLSRPVSDPGWEGVAHLRG